MTYYLDTSAVYSYIFEDANSAAIDKWFESAKETLTLSDWAEAESVALVNRRLRSADLAIEAAVAGLADFDLFAREHTVRCCMSGPVGARAAALARDPLPKLSAADARRLALSADGDHRLVTFDQRLANAARARGFAFDMP